MKKRNVYLLILFVTALFQVGCESGGDDNVVSNEAKIENCNCNDVFLDPDYGHFYTEKRDVPYTGDCESYFPDGTISAKKYYVNGKLEGEYLEYHENGNLKSEWHFLKNRQHGDYKGYDENGNLLYHTIFYKGDQDSVIYP